MNVKDLTYTKLNKMFGELIAKHEYDTEFYSAESAEKYANDELIRGENLCIQNAFDELAEKVEGLKETFDWSFGISANSWDVGLIHLDVTKYQNTNDLFAVKHSMVKAEIIRRIPTLTTNDFVMEVMRIVREMECVYI